MSYLRLVSTKSIRNVAEKKQEACTEERKLNSGRDIKERAGDVRDTKDA